jgi:hypothetical protein
MQHYSELKDTVGEGGGEGGGEKRGEEGRGGGIGTQKPRLRCWQGRCKYHMRIAAGQRLAHACHGGACGAAGAKFVLNVTSIKSGEVLLLR